MNHLLHSHRRKLILLLGILVCGILLALKIASFPNVTDLITINH